MKPIYSQKQKDDAGTISSSLVRMGVSEEIADIIAGNQTGVKCIDKHGRGGSSAGICRKQHDKLLQQAKIGTESITDHNARTDKMIEEEEAECQSQTALETK